MSNNKKDILNYPDKRSLFYSMKQRTTSILSNISETWKKPTDEPEVILQDYRTSRKSEYSIEGFGPSPSVEYLTEYGENFSSVTQQGLPLHFEIINVGLKELMKITSNRYHNLEEITWHNISKENLEETFKDGTTQELNVAFLWAAFTKRWDLLEGFLKLGAQLNYYEPSFGLSALHLSAFIGCINGINFLISQGCDVNAIHKCYTPLHCTAFGNSPETARILLDKGANIQALTNDLHCTIESVLHCAVRANAANCIKLFCDKGADVNQLDFSGRTSIHLAAELGYNESLSILVKTKNACLNYQTKEKLHTALHLAARGQHWECISVLLESGACPNITNFRSETPLHLAARLHAYKCVKTLLKKGDADPNANDVDKRTPLHSTVCKANRTENVETIKLLVKYSADVNPKDHHGFTPLHLAAQNELSECAETLIMCNADLTAKCNSGYTALGIVVRKTPVCIEAVKKKLDESISFSPLNTPSKEVELQIDFSPLLRYNHPREIYFLTTLVLEGQKELLLHPLCTAFLYLKWKKIRRYYIGRQLYYFIFVLVLSSYVLTGVAHNCYNYSKNITDTTLEDSRHLCLNGSLMGQIMTRHPVLIEMQWYILVIMTLGTMFRKIVATVGYSSLKQYISLIENILEWSVMLSVFLISFVYTGRTYDWQNHISAFAVLLAWINLMYNLGQLPVFGPYVEMYTSVQGEFAKLFLVFSCLLIGFTISFCVLFPESAVFSDISTGLISVLVMAIGEMNFELITDSNAPDPPFALEGSMQIIYILFILTVTIILLNLLIGIAVHDIQGLQKTAKMTKLVKQTKLISYIETAIYNDYFHKKLLMLLQWTTLVSNKPYGVLYVKPLNPREKRLPKDILLATFDVARKHKKKCKLNDITNCVNKFKKNSEQERFSITSITETDIFEFNNNVRNLRKEMTEIKNILERLMKVVDEIKDK